MKIIHDPKNKQINFLDERFYTNDGINYYPSVTTVLDVYPKGKGFQDWLKNLGLNTEEVLRRAGEQGTNVHNAIDSYLKGEELSWMNEEEKANYTLQEWMMILRFVDFFTTYKPEIIAHEVPLVSNTLELGGTIDLVCRINGEVWLLDYKTSNALHTSYELQIAAYAMMWNETEPTARVDRTGIIHLKSATRGPDKTGKSIKGEGWLLKEFDRSYEEAFKLFRYVQRIWKEENPTYKPKNLIYPSIISLNKEI